MNDKNSISVVSICIYLCFIVAPIIGAETLHKANFSPLMSVVLGIPLGWAAVILALLVLARMNRR